MKAANNLALSLRLKLQEESQSLRETSRLFQRLTVR